GAAFAGAGPLATPASAQPKPGQPTYHYLPANSDTVHWGYFSKLLKPQLEVDSGDYITIEAITHHAGDDTERMVKGDPGVESIYLWTKEKKGVTRRGAGPVDGRLLDLHRTGTGRHSRSPYHRREAAALRQPRLRRQVVRQQRGGLVGLPL